MDLIRYRGDGLQAEVLEAWLTQLKQDYGDRGWRWMAMQPNCGDGCRCPFQTKRLKGRPPQSPCYTS